MLRAAIWPRSRIEPRTRAARPSLATPLPGQAKPGPRTGHARPRRDRAGHHGEGGHRCILASQGPTGLPSPRQAASSSRSMGKVPPAGARRPANHANEKHSQTRDISFRRSDVNRHCRTAHAVEEHGAESMFLGERALRFCTAGWASDGGKCGWWSGERPGKEFPGPHLLFSSWRQASGLSASAFNDFKYRPRGLNAQSEV